VRACWFAATTLRIYVLPPFAGVVGVIFEARPEALIQITSLAIKSGNGVILKGEQQPH
jgi:gamma-glutamyl phosphate reductase